MHLLHCACVDIITQIIQELYYESLLFEICGRSGKNWVHH